MADSPRKEPPAAAPGSFLNMNPFVATGVRIGQAEEQGLENAISALRSGTSMVVRATEEEAAKGGRFLAEGAATATRPAADAAAAMGRGLSDVAGFLTVAAEDAKDIAKKVLIGEVVLVGALLVVGGAALWFSRKAAVPAVTKILLGKGVG